MYYITFVINHNIFSFLYDRVRHQRIVSWKDAYAQGKVYMAYHKLANDCNKSKNNNNSDDDDYDDIGNIIYDIRYLYLYILR